MSNAKVDMKWFEREDFNKDFKPKMKGTLPHDKDLLNEIKANRDCENKGSKHQIAEDGFCLNCYYKTEVIRNE